MIRPPFPEIIDSSMLSAFRACPQKFNLEFLHHYKPINQSVHLHAGAAYAKGLEIMRKAFYEENLSTEQALSQGLQALAEAYGTFECPSDSAKSLERMLGALEYYSSKYPLDSDGAIPAILPSGQRGIEFNFAEPLDFLHPDTGNPILYVGRFDAIMEYAHGLYGEDDKTATQLGTSWVKQWDLRSQFTAYCWGAKQANIELNGFLVRGVSILKTKYDTLEVITYRPQWMLDRWYEQTLRDLTRMQCMWQEGYFDLTLDNACNEYGGCMFRQICLSQNSDPWLKANFIRRQWNPMTRIETELEHYA